MNLFVEPFVRGPHAFKATLEVEWTAAPGDHWNREVRGRIHPGETIELTWVPPRPCIVKTVVLVTPSGCLLRSLKVAGEETIDPRFGLPAARFAPGAKPVDLGIRMQLGAIVVGVLERTE